MSAVDGARAHDFDLDATVLRPSFGGAVVRDRLHRPFAFGVDAVGLDALADQVLLHRFRTLQRQALVGGRGADVVGMADDDDDLQVHTRELRDQVIEARLRVLVIDRVCVREAHVSRERDLLAGRGRRRWGRGGWGRWRSFGRGRWRRRWWWWWRRGRRRRWRH